MSSVLFAIDSYLSNQERADVCKNLIEQIRKVYPEKKILLINKFRNSWGLDQIVDHYYFLGESFMVGYPPKDILDSQLYERPYTYFTISAGVFENWFPLVNVTDHVANIYNSFFISSQLAKGLGYDKVFKIEYDTVFDEEEFRSISNDIESFQDFLFFGTRREGEWAKSHHYLVDVHFIGYSVRCFETCSFLRNDQDFWDLCRRVGYYGKWIEYIIPMLIEERRKTVNLQGIHFEGKTSARFPKTKMDVINGEGEWADSMRKMPKICRCKEEHEAGDSLTDITLFYWNNYNDGEVTASCRIISQETQEVIFEDEHTLQPLSSWAFNRLPIKENVRIETQAVFANGKTYHQKVDLSPQDIKNLDPRFVFK